MPNPVRGFVSGLSLPLRGFALVLAPRLLALALAPVAVGLLAAGAVGALLWHDPDVLVRALWGRPESCDRDGALAAMVCGAWGLARFVLAVLSVALTALVASRVASAPFMDLLAERLLKGRGVRPPPGVVALGDLPMSRSIPRSLASSVRRLAVYLAGLGLLFALVLVPGGAVVSTPLSLAWTALWVHLDTVQYALQWVGPARVADALACARRRPAETAGFVVAQGLLSVVPLAGALLVPATVAGACLYVEADPPGESATAVALA